MISPACTIPDCGQPVHDQAYACPGHVAQLDRDLVAVPDLAAEAEITATRQTRRAPAVRRSAAGLIPFDATASAAGHTLTNLVTTWTRHVLAERGLTLPRPDARIGPLCPEQHCRHLTCLAIAAGGTPASLAVAVTWLRGQLDWIRHRPEVGELVDGLADALAAVRRAVDLPPDRAYVGRCGECMTPLYARPGADEVTCRQCATVWGVDEQREWMLAAARDTVGTAAEISRALTALGREVTAARVRGFARYGKIRPACAGDTPWPTYRLGDVLDVLEAASGAA